MVILGNVSKKRFRGVFGRQVRRGGFGWDAQNNFGSPALNSLSLRLPLTL